VSEFDFLALGDLRLFEEDLEANSRQERQDRWDDKDHRPVDDILAIDNRCEAILQLSRED
jgi:hypothetical protein